MKLKRWVRDPKAEQKFRDHAIKHWERMGVDMKLKKYQAKQLLNEQAAKDLKEAMEAASARLRSLPPCDLSGLSLLITEGELMERNVKHECTCPGTDPDDSWAHRSAGMKCRSCMWFVLKKYKPQMITQSADPTYPSKPVKYINNNRIGRCRRHAPTMNGYPVVFEEDWCGDHKLDETKL